MVVEPNRSGDLGLALQEEMMALVRAFGLHRAEETPCGQPISVAEAYAITELVHKTELAQNDLGQRLNLAKSTVSRLIDKLVSKGLVRRARSGGDGRVSVLALTEAGETTAEQLAEARRAKFAGVLDAIPSSSREQVLEALELLVQAMRSSTESVERTPR